MIRTAIRVRASDAEVAFVRLEPLLAAGFEEVACGDDVEFVVYGDNVTVDFPELVSVSRAPVLDGWESAWHSHLSPVTVGALTIRPPWLPGPGLVVDPGMTFGLASHPTTQLCLALLQELPRTALADWGCGCGVQSVAALALGYAPVTAIELDPGAVETARTNGVDAHVGDVVRDRPWAATVVANLTAPLLVLAASSPPAGTGPVTLITSGLAVEHADVARAAWEPFGFVERERRLLDGWAASVLEHP